MSTTRGQLLNDGISSVQTSNLKRKMLPSAIIGCFEVFALLMFFILFEAVHKPGNNFYAFENQKHV